MMSANEQALERIIGEVEQLPPADRVRLIQRVVATLVHPAAREESRRLVFGRYSHGRMSTDEDLAIAEWRPSDAELNGP